jgi:hypothetical protein
MTPKDHLRGSVRPLLSWGVLLLVIGAMSDPPVHSVQSGEWWRDVCAEWEFHGPSFMWIACGLSMFALGLMRFVKTLRR